MEVIQNFFQTVAKMQWSDYLDILIVAFLLYKILPLIRITGAMRIAKVILVVVVLDRTLALVDEGLALGLVCIHNLV